MPTPRPSRRPRGRPAVVAPLCLLLLAVAPRPDPAAAQPEQESPDRSCEYIAEMQAVSLPGQEGQPAAIEITSNTFATYRRNLGLGRRFGRGYAGRRVLDVGAGLSEFVDVMADRYGADAYALDVAYAELDLSGLSPECRELFHRRRLAMDATRILFPSNFFDLVVCHSLLGWFFTAEGEPERDVRPRLRRGMQILTQMVRVTSPGGEVRATDFPDPEGEWYARNRPELVDDYRAAFREFLRSFGPDPGDGETLEIAFHYDDDGRGYTVIRKLERLPRSDAAGEVSVIRVQRRPRPPTRRP